MVLKNRLPSSSDLLKKEEEDQIVYPTGSEMLNLAIGCIDRETGEFGIPSRTILEVFGHNQTGKTLLAESLARSVLMRNPKNKVILISSEEPNLARMKTNGLDGDRVLVWTFTRDEKDIEKNPTAYITAESGLDLALDYVREPDENVKLVIIDSIKALVSLKDTNEGQDIKDMADKDIPAVRARLIEKFILKWLTFNNSNAILLMINQSSESIGPDYMIGGIFKTKTCGGRFKEFMAYLRIKCDSVKLESDKEHPLMGVKEQVGFEFFYTLIKNKFAPTTGNRRARATFLFDPPGFQTAEELLNMAMFLELIGVRGGGNYDLPAEYKDPDGKTSIRGRDNLVEYIDNNKTLFDFLKSKIRARRDELFKAKKGEAKPAAKKVLQ
jgi:RecA/RadA recombinase